MIISDADRQASVGFALRQTTYIETQVNETVYPEIQYPELIPVDTSADAFAKTVTHFTSDQFGRAGWINGNSNDIPTAGTVMSPHEAKIHTAGVGYAFGWEEVEYARRNGRDLPNDDAMAARRAYEEFVDDVALNGAPEKQFEGLTNHSAPVAASAVTGDWANATEDQILADINAAIFGIATDTRYTSIADTILLPDESMMYLTGARINGTSDTALSFLQRNNVYTARTGRQLLIRSVRGLDTAGAGDTKRMVAYRRDPQVLKLHIPMPHQFFPVYQDGALNWVVPGVFRLGGLDIRRPKEVRYVDGI